MEVKNSAGRRFRISVLRKGDRYGLNKVLTWDTEEPGVEFYDLTHEKFGTEGQFVTRYYWRTLETHTPGVGLDLDGGEPVWSLDGECMDRVVGSVREFV